MLPMNELEYTGIVDRLSEPQARFTVRDGATNSREAA
jgi:hypothetical protein